MSYSPLRHKIILRAVLTAALLAVAIPAHAATSCNYSSVEPTFLPWLDLANYTPFPSSSFEQGASGWSFGGNTNVVAGDGNAALNAGTHAVEIPGAGTAKSPWLCVNLTTPSIRFFIRRTSGNGFLRVKGVLSGPSGTMSLLVIPLWASTTWRPSAVVLFPPALLTVLSRGTFQAQFTFTADPGTTFRIDDVYLDPFKMTGK
jgi:hypothetical protein